MVLSLVGCGGGFDRAEAVARLRDDNPDLTADQAGCVADRLIERFGLDELEPLLAADPAEPGFEEAQFTDQFRCGVEGDVGQLLVDQLTASGVDPADAPCVADALQADLTDADVDVLLSGEITSAFAAKFDTAMADCGALP